MCYINTMKCSQINNQYILNRLNSNNHWNDTEAFVVNWENYLLSFSFNSQNLHHPQFVFPP